MGHNTADGFRMKVFFCGCRLSKFLNGIKSFFTRGKQRLVAGFLIVLILLLPLLLRLSAGKLPGEKAIADQAVIKEGQHIQQKYIKKKDPVLVLFTSLKMDEKKYHIYDNTIRNWAQLKPAVRPVLFHEGPEEDWITKIKKADWWDVYRATNTFDGIPILKHLFLSVQKLYPNAQLYGFANADILFDESLVVTLEHVLRQYDRKHELFMVGRRTNGARSHPNFRDLNDIRGVARHWNSELAFDGLIQDYFVISKKAIPWDRVPDFLVGKEGYNPWLTAYALNANILTLDVTNTVLALHQTTSTGNYESRSSKMATVNKEIIGPNFDYNLGQIDCAMYYTSFVEANPFHQLNTSIRISPRKPNPCFHLFQLYGIYTQR